MPGPMPALSAALPWITSITLPSSFTSKPIELARLSDFSSLSRALKRSPALSR